MNKGGHVVNALLLSVGLGIIIHGEATPASAETVARIGPPVVLGALLPDLDTAFGTHRKTFHNVWVLGLAVAFPFVFDNLHYVWLGVATHYVLDLCGNVKGMGLLYPLPGFYDVPVGVTVDSRWADVVTLAVTAVQLGALWLVVDLGYRGQLAGPTVPVL